jgi:hypothetical protein
MALGHEMESGQTGKRAGLSAAIRRYPQFELAIRRLMNADEGFRDICEELADAETALSKVDDLPAALRETRRAEWQELVDRLAGELKTAVEGRDAHLRPRAFPVRPTK